MVVRLVTALHPQFEGTIQDVPRKINEPSPVLIGALFVALLALTGWAFFPTGSESALPSGVRAQPGDVYDPVAAGEELPDGFRQLLPRDGIQPIYEPTFVAASQSSWSGNTEVIGVQINGEAKAYPVSWLGGRELVVDDVGGEPILVSW